MTNPDVNATNDTPGITGNPADLATVEGVDRWLRRELGRQVVLALVAPPGNDGERRLLALRSALAAYREMRVIEADASEARDTTDLLKTLRAAARADVDALLVWVPGTATSHTPTTGQPASAVWLRAVLGEIEDIGLRDRAFVALVGPDVTRSRARAAGYEDGWSDEPASALMARLAREVVRREEYLRRGSSPPCYLE